MEVQTYRQIDSFGGVTVYELGDLDYPFRDFIEKRGVDIGAIQDCFDQYFSRYDIPYDPEEILPLLPSGFDYIHDGNVNRVDQGIVFSNSVDALMTFAGRNLRSIDHPKSIAGQFGEDTNLGLKKKSNFLRQVQSQDTHNIPFDAQPFVYLPDQLSQQNSTRRRQDLTADFFLEEENDQQWIIFKYKTVNNLLRNPRRFQKKSSVADDIDIRNHNISEIEPMYVHQQDLSFDESSDKVPQTWNFVVGCKERKMDRQFIWSFEDRSGTSVTSGELPVELCEQFEEGGRQVIAPEEFSIEAPLRFLEPKGFVGADINELRDLKSTNLPRVEELVSEDSRLEELLKSPTYVKDVRQPLDFHSLYLWRKKKQRDEKLKESSAAEALRQLGVTYEEVPTLKQYSVSELAEMTLEKFLELTGLTLEELKEAGKKATNRSFHGATSVTDTKLLAKILQQTQQSLYHPEQPPAGYECMDTYFDSDMVWFGLCEPSHHD